jgi:membrane associated rhomboid family serine protease
VTWTLLALNALAFFVELGQSTPAALQSFIQAWGVVPREYSAGRDLSPFIPLPFFVTLVTSMFLHGGFAHLGGNMLYLWIFGDNVEDRLGHLRYLVFYLLCGAVAALAQVYIQSGSSVPMIGASGAISGVLGAYLVLFPHSRVLTLIPIVFFLQIVELPAVVLLGVWFLMQLVSGVGSLGARADVGGVAFWAHVAGFVTGLLAVNVFKQPERQTVEWWDGVRR